MGKLTSLNGKVVGKIGAVVFSTNAGQIIGREYNPNVANPNTSAQVDQRAKLKLMSQLAAALAPVIAIPKEGLKSSRNLFIKKNFGNVDANEGVAQITYENLQLTNGNAGIPAIYATRFQQSGVQIRLEERCDAAISRVVYIMYKKTSEATLQYVQSVIADAAGTEGTFPASMLYCEGDLVLFAYGMKDLNSKASAKYSDMNVQNAEDIAKLSCARKINYGDYQFTMTRGTTLFAGENETTVIGDNQARVFVTASGPGTVSGAGVFDLNTQVTVHAIPGEDAAFVGWKENGSEEIISTDADYTFTLTAMADLVAVFRSTNVPTYTISASASPVEGGTVSGAGSYASGESCTLRAIANEGFHFVAWKKNGQTVATAQSYTFVVNEAASFVAEFAEDAENGISEVSVDNSILSANTTLATGNHTIAGNFQAGDKLMNVATYVAASEPTIGSNVTGARRFSVANNQFEGQRWINAGEKMWIIAGIDGEENGFLVKGVYEYHIEGQA